MWLITLLITLFSWFISLSGIIALCYGFYLAGELERYKIENDKKLSDYVMKLERRIESLEKMSYTQNSILQNVSEQMPTVSTNSNQLTVGKMRNILPEIVARTGRWHTNGDHRYYYIGKTIISNTWAQIDGLWYYFHPSGKMAVNTTVDGYEIGADGVRKTS